MKPMFCVRSVVFFVIGILMIGPASAGEFRAEMTLKPIDIRDVETSAADVKRIVLARISQTTPHGHRIGVGFGGCRGLGGGEADHL